MKIHKEGKILNHSNFYVWGRKSESQEKIQRGWEIRQTLYIESLMSRVKKDALLLCGYDAIHGATVLFHTEWKFLHIVFLILCSF